MPSGGGSQGGGFPTPDPCVGTPMDGDACTATTAGAAGGFNPGAFGACSSGTLICVCFNSTYTCFDPTNIGAGGAFSFGGSSSFGGSFSFGGGFGQGGASAGTSSGGTAGGAGKGGGSGAGGGAGRGGGSGSGGGGGGSSGSGT